MADSMLDGAEASATDVTDLLREPGAVELLVAFARMPRGAAREKLVAFVESLGE